MLPLLRILSLCSVAVVGSALVSCAINSEKETSAEKKQPQKSVSSVAATSKNPPVTNAESTANPVESGTVNDKNIDIIVTNEQEPTEQTRADKNAQPREALADKETSKINPQVTISESTPSNLDSTPEALNLNTIDNAKPLISDAIANELVELLCTEIGGKLSSVSTKECLDAALVDSGGRSVQKRAIILKEFKAIESKQPLGRVLLMGGIHGDEYSSVSIVFKWLNTLNQHHSGVFEWRVVPLLNPDGLLRKQSQRQNHVGVDLNRNFPTPDWNADALKYWRDRTYRNPRRYPGPVASSEPETQWFIQQISAFEPDAIVAVHAPHSLVDYDGPQKPPHKLGRLYLRELGIYPGSLGNYAGVAKNIPVVTIELPSAGIMPSDNEIDSMWSDLVAWLQREVPKQRLARSRQDEQSTQ